MVVSLKTTKHKDKALFAARIPELGLTAYGHSTENAEQEVKNLFRTFIQNLREKGQLKKRLDQAKVKWFWEDEYPNDWIPVEDTAQENPILIAA